MNSRPIMARRIRSFLAVHRLAIPVLALQLLPAPVRSADCTAYDDYFYWTDALVDPVHGAIARESPAVSWPLAAGIQDRGNHVFLYDVSNPKDIEFQAIVDPGKNPLAIALEGDLLAVWIKGSIQIYDVHSPRTPVLRSEIPYPHKVLCCSGTLDLIDRLLYTTGRGDHLGFDPIAVFDLANPDAPVLLEELQIPCADHGIAARNDIAYVACGSRGIGFVDLRTRQQPTFLGFLQSNRGEFVEDVAIVSDHLVVLDRHLSTELVTYDLSIPTEPKEVHRTSDPTIAKAFNLSASGDVVLVETYETMPSSSALYRLNAEGEPTFLDIVPKVGNYSTLVGTVLFSGAYLAPLDRLDFATVAAQLPLRLSGLAIKDDVAFCGTFENIRTVLNAYSIFDAENPRVLSRLDITALNAYPKKMAITGDRLFFSSDSHIISADISDPRDLRIVSRLQVWDQTLFSLDGIAATQALVCATSRKYDDKAGVLHIFAWGEQSAPEEVGRLEGVWSGDPAFLDDATVIAARDGHPALVDLSDPANPQVVDSHPELTRAFCFATQGPIVYVGRYSVISILERTGESSLDVIGHVGIGAHDIAISGDRAYTRGKILDISDPRDPRFAGQLEVPYLQMLGGPEKVGAGTRTIVFAGNFTGLTTAWSPCSPHSRVSRAIDEDEDVLPHSESASNAGTPMALDVDPNPFTASLRINASVPANERIDIKIYDAAGRHVRTMPAGSAAAGAQTITWDGRDSGGRDVGAGVYFVRLQSAAQDVSRRVVKLR